MRVTAAIGAAICLMCMWSQPGNAESQNFIAMEQMEPSETETEWEETETGWKEAETEWEEVETEWREVQTEQRETGTESAETEQETEEVQRYTIWISNIWPAYENGYKIYDGTTRVELEGDVIGLPHGAQVEMWGKTESEDVGSWKVEPQVRIHGLESKESYDICLEEKELDITVLPKPLTITISDGVKYYYTPLEFSNIEFLTEEEPVQVTGFVNEQIPDGFQKPKLEWNHQVLQKESPMYRHGERIEYKGALVVKVDEDGRPTGNATSNYCFVLDEKSGYYEPGTVFLREPVLNGWTDYAICGKPEEGCYLDEQGRIWLRAGTSLQMKPKGGGGFQTGTVTPALMENGSVQMQLLALNKKGEITASSWPHQIDYQVDEDAPRGEMVIDGETFDGQVFYKNHTISCQIGQVWDDGSGVATVELCAVKGTVTEDAENYDKTHSQKWKQAKELILSEEGVYTVFGRLRDQVGNVRFIEGATVMIDLTGPELEIQGVLPGSANGGLVEPRVFCQDETYLEGSLRVTLTGRNVGEKSFAQTRKQKTFGEEIFISDIPREKRWDDLYVLHATASDRAGNRTEKKLAFSVNRFGSVFRLDDHTRNAMEKYYLQEPVELVIWEFNVDDILSEQIRVGHESSIQKLRKGTQYRVQPGYDKKGWREYCYRISAANFKDEGVYYAVLSTADRAENVTDSQRQELKMEFSIDCTPPAVFVSGVEKDNTYKEEKRIAVITCQDDQKLENVQIYLNEKLVADNQETRQTLEITAANKWQTLEVRASDGAGNVSYTEKIDFYIHEDEEHTDLQPKKAALNAEKKENPVEEIRQETKETDAEKVVLISGETGKHRKSKEGKTGLQTLIFLAILGIVGGYLYKIKGVK